MPDITENEILNALRAIEDPDLHRDIVSLGFIKDIKICEGIVAFKIELTTPACPVKDIMQEEARQVVAKLPGVTTVNVEMTAQVRSAGGAGQELIPGVRHVIAVASGKGGVGKSTVAANLAVALARTGANVGLLDADIYGPSIPLIMGVNRKPPVIETKNGPKMRTVGAHGVAVMSLGFILQPDQAVVWRGPMLGKAVSDMLTGVLWGELDYLIIDLPPGTGDVPMSLAQLVPISGVVIVTTPQQAAQEIARKSVLMFRSLEQSVHRTIPILGLIENMSGGIFGAGGGEQAATRFEIPYLGAIPLDESVTQGGDAGRPVILRGPESPVAAAFMDIAKSLAASISVLQYEKE